MKPDYDEQLDMRRWPVADRKEDRDELVIGLIVGAALAFAALTWLASAFAGLIAWGGGML